VYTAPSAARYGQRSIAFVRLDSREPRIVLRRHSCGFSCLLEFSRFSLRRFLWPERLRDETSATWNAGERALVSVDERVQHAHSPPAEARAT
jgi:hypothetical protein